MSTQTMQSPKQNSNAQGDKPKKPFFSRIIADKLASQLREGNAPTQRKAIPGIPYNPANGRPFHGINSMSLMMSGRRDPRWMAFDDAANCGYQVKAGEKGTPTQKWLPPKPGEKRQAITTYMYNAEQLNFIPPMKRQEVKQDPFDRVTDLLNNCGAKIVHDQKERAFYSPANDEIHLPKPESYKDNNKYCQDALNAYFHSTGHPSRNDRQTFDSPKRYEQNTEELICTVSTTMMCAELGIPNDATKNADLAVKWADNLEQYPIQFGQAMQQVDNAVFQTLRLEQSIDRQLNPQNELGWRPVAEASPAIAVKTFLTQKEVLNLVESEPEKVNAFQHDDKEVFSLPGTGRIVGKKEVDLPDADKATEMTVLTEGYDREGNTYDVTLKATVRVNDSGLSETLKQPEATSIKLATKEMSLPLDWTGEIAVSPMHEDEKGTMLPGRSEEFPQFYGAFARGEDNDHLIATFNRENQATYYASLVERQFTYQQERPQQQTTKDVATEKAELSAEQDEREGESHAPDEKEIEARQTGSRPSPEQEQTTIQEQSTVLKQEEQQTEQPKNREELLDDAKEKIAERLKEDTQDADKAAARCKAMIAKTFTVPKEPTPYMQAKGVGLMPGTYQNKGSTCIPLYNAEGDLRSIAYADKDGNKRYAKGTDRAGCAFFDQKAVEKSNVVGFSVGAATAATVSQTLNGIPVVATMDAKNLPVVVAAFQEKYPEKQPVIFANNNIAYEKENGRNPGKFYAEKAAKSTGALIVSPRFAADETSKSFVDFNDLATKSKYGKTAVKEQCESALEKAKEMAAEKAKEKAQEKTRSNKELARGK